MRHSLTPAVRYAALATRNTEFYEDRAFSFEGIATMRPSLRNMAEPWMPVYAEARARDIRLMTADRVQAEGIDPRKVLLIAYDWNPDAQRLARQGARPAVLVSFEPPVIAWQLYYNLPSISRRFPHVFLFEGARDRVHPSARFHPLIFPQPCPPPRPTGKAWGQRRFLVMVNSNKALAHPLDLARWFDRPREVSLKRELAALRYRPIARVRYMTRLRAIQAFAASDDFDLYGEGWQRQHPAVPDEVHAAAQRAFRGPVDDKITLLAGYRFALAMENTRFPGYLSEKLFDCMYARCIPIYYGAPDVAQYVPPSSFIDARQFPTFGALNQFLRSMTESEATRYLEAAHAFLTSPAFERFCADRFARDMVDAVASVREQ